MDFVVARFLLDHYIHDSLPPVECMMMANGVVDELDSCGDNGFPTSVQDFAFDGCWVKTVGVEERLVVP